MSVNEGTCKCKDEYPGKVINAVSSPSFPLDVTTFIKAPVKRTQKVPSEKVRIVKTGSWVPSCDSIKGTRLTCRRGQKHFSREPRDEWLSIHSRGVLLLWSKLNADILGPQIQPNKQGNKGPQRGIRTSNQIFINMNNWEWVGNFGVNRLSSGWHGNENHKRLVESLPSGHYRCCQCTLPEWKRFYVENWNANFCHQQAHCFLHPSNNSH